MPSPSPPLRDSIALSLRYRPSFLLVLSNPLDYLIVRVLSIPRIVRFRSGAEIRACRRNLHELRLLIALANLGVDFCGSEGAQNLCWAVSPDLRTLRVPPGISFALDLLDPIVMAETFLYEVHYFGGNLSGKTILDVGANIGDTALYFASKGATVHAFEPDPLNFRVLRTNLDLNPHLAKKIVAHQVAVGRDGVVPFWAQGDSGSSAYYGSGEQTHVQSMGLGTIVDTLGLKSPFLLKADCKGCESELVRDPAISMFQNVQIEYARVCGRGDPDSIVAELMHRGFANIRVYKHNNQPLTLRNHGLIRASMQDLERT